MILIENETYLSELDEVNQIDLPWEKLSGKTILISGGSGMIGSYIVDLLMRRNLNSDAKIKVIALGRDPDKARSRFPAYLSDPLFSFVKADINDPADLCDLSHIDLILHAASNTHPLQYSIDPIGTIMTNILGTKNLLDLAVRVKAERFLFISSVEIYGENTTGIGKFSESSLGYIDSNSLRAGYPESKRAGEALCQAYLKQYGLDIVIPRLPRTYGPTMQMSDSKAIAQFIKNSLNAQDIVLKSAGTQFYSFAYVADAVTGLLSVLLKGATGQAYNIADAQSDITLRQLAEKIAAIAGTKVVIDLPDSTEQAGFSKATTAILDAAKIKKIGWQAKFDLDRGLAQTLRILSSLH